MARIREIRERVMDGMRKSPVGQEMRAWGSGVRRDLGKKGHELVDIHLPRAGATAHRVLTRLHDSAHQAVDDMQPRLQQGLHDMIHRRTGVRHDPTPPETTMPPQQTAA